MNDEAILSHQHQQLPSKQQAFFQLASIQSPKKVFDSQTENKSYFSSLLIKSKIKINPQQMQKIEKLRVQSQIKAFHAVLANFDSYFEVLRQHSQVEVNLDLAKQVTNLLSERKANVLKYIEKPSFQLNQISNKPIQIIKKELDVQLLIVRTGSADLEKEHVQSISNKKQIRQRAYAQFQQKSYWKNKSLEQQNILHLLHKLHNQKMQSQKAKIKFNLKQHENFEKQQEKKNQQKHIAQSQKKQLLIKKILTHHENKKLEYENNQTKKHKIEHFLEQYRSKTPIHIRNEEKFLKELKKGEEENLIKLEEIKASKKHKSLAELRDELQIYEEKKAINQRYIEDRNKEIEIREQENQNQLRSLYRVKSKHFQQEGIKPERDLKSERKQKMNKMSNYSLLVFDQHKPTIDLQKKSELISSIRMEEERIQKIKSKHEAEPRLHGLSYLNELKKQNQTLMTSSKRKSNSSNTHDIQEQPGKPLIDYSIAKDKYFKYKMTLSNWKLIMESSKIQAKEKYHQIQNCIGKMEEEQFKLQKNKRNSSKQKAIELQRTIDRYQLAKIEAKIALLKDQMIDF